MTAAPSLCVCVCAGTNLGPSCTNVSAWLGPWPMALTHCNATTIVGTAPVGAGTGFLVSVSVGGQSNTLAGVPLSYAPPVVTSLGGNLTLPASGVFGLSGAPAVVLLFGYNFGPPSAPLTVTYGGVSGVAAIRGVTVSC